MKFRGERFVFSWKRASETHSYSSFLFVWARFAPDTYIYNWVLHPDQGLTALDLDIQEK